LKDLQAKRKEIRAELEKKLAQQKKEEEEKIRKEEQEKKAREAEEKRKRLEEAEKKRDSMALLQKEKQSSPYFSSDPRKQTRFSSIQDAKREIVKTKEQLADEKKISLSIRIKPLEIDGLGKDQIKARAADLWQNIVRLETEKYDLEERQKRQHYDLKELSERQTQRLRLKAVRMGLDAEALTGKYPPKIQTASKFERRADNKTYEDKKMLFDGGWEALTCEMLEREWKERMGEWNNQQKSKLPKWFGERPGKKTGDPESPEDEEIKDESIQEDIGKIENDESIEEQSEEEEEEYEVDEEEKEEEE